MKIIETQQYRMREWPIRPHGHLHTWELHYFQNGNGVLSIDGRNRPVSPRTFYLAPPGEVHGISPSEGACHFYYIEMEPDAELEPILRLVSRNLAACPQVPQGLRGTRFFEDLLWKVHSGDRHLAKAAQLSTEALLYTLASDTSRSLDESPPLVGKAIEILEKIPDGEGKLGAIEDKLGVSRSYLDRCFKKATGMGPVQFHTQIRMRRAAVLLSETPATIREIADHLGFSSEFYFSRAFKKFAGLPPKDYRKRQNQDAKPRPKAKVRA